MESSLYSKDELDIVLGSLQVTEQKLKDSIDRRNPLNYFERLAIKSEKELLDKVISAKEKTSIQMGIPAG